MKKRRLLILLAAATLAILVGTFWRQEPPSQLVTLPNGEQYRLAYAVWGAHQEVPTMPAKLISRLPVALTKLMPQRLLNRVGPVGASGYIFDYGPPQPCLCLWFRLEGTNVSRPLQLLYGLLEDDQGVSSGGFSSTSAVSLGNVKWLKMRFFFVPRRSAVLQCRLFQGSPYDSGSHRELACVCFSNPTFGRFPQWQPEPLPATKTAGDLSVRLTDFSIGTANPANIIVTNEGRLTRFRRSRAGESPEAAFRLELDSLLGTNETWMIERAELSDATGNRCVDNFDRPWAITNEYCIGPAFWPEEAAWRLALDFKRRPGHDPEEVVTFTNVPVPAVGASNIVFLTNSIHGVAVVLKQVFIREPDREPMPHGGGSSLVAEVLNRPETFVVDFLRLNANTGWEPKGSYNLWYSWKATNSAGVPLYSIPADVRTLNPTWVVQKARTVQFLVKPPQLK